MSVANLHVTADAVRILSDTLVYSSEDRPLRLCLRKTEVAPSGKFIWTTRGVVADGDRFDMLAREAATIDEAEVVAPLFLERLAASCRRMEITLAGFSDRAGAMVALQVVATRFGDVIASVIDPGVYMRPGTQQRGPDMPATITEAQFVRLGAAQERLKDLDPYYGCMGGVMHLTTVTRAGAHQRIVGLYSTYERDSLLPGGDPNAEAVALFRGERRMVAA